MSRKLELEHFCVSKFISGGVIRGGYAIVAHSPNSTIDHLPTKVAAVDIIGGQPNQRKQPKYRGFAMFPISESQVVFVKYEFSSVREAGGYPLYKHYVFLTPRDLHDLEWNLPLILKVKEFQQQYQVLERTEVAPIQIDTSEIKTSVNQSESINIDTNFKAGFVYILNTPLGIISYSSSTPERRLRTILQWLSLLPTQVALAMSFSTNAFSAANSAIKIWFLDDAAPTTAEFNYLSLENLASHFPGRVYVNQVTNKLDEYFNNRAVLDKLRLTDYANSLSWGEILDRSIQLPNLEQLPTNPDKRKEEIEYYQPLLSKEELMAWVISLIPLYQQKGPFTGAFDALVQWSHLFQEQQTVGQLATALAPLNDAMISDGLRRSEIRKLVNRIITVQIQNLLAQQRSSDAASYISRLFTNPNVDSEIHSTLFEIIALLPKQGFLQATTALIIRYGTQGIDVLVKQLRPKLAREFPSLLQLTDRVDEAVRASSSKDQIKYLYNVYIDAALSSKAEVWLAICLAYAIKRDKWELLDDTSLYEAQRLFQYPRDRSSEANWEAVWQLISENSSKITNLSDKSWNELFEWALLTKDYQMALFVVMKLQAAPLFLWDRDLKPSPYESRILEIHLADDQARGALLGIQPSQDSFPIYLSWLRLAVRFINSYLPNTQLIDVQSLIERITNPRFQGQVFKELAKRTEEPTREQVTMYEGLLQFYLLLIHVLTKSPLADLDKTAHKAAVTRNMALFAELIYVALRSNAECFYILMLKQWLPGVERSELTQWCDALEQSAQLLFGELAERDSYRKIHLIHQYRGLSTEAFIMENVFLAMTFHRITDTHLGVLNLMLEAIPSVLDYDAKHDRRLADYLKQWLPKATEERAYYVHIVDALPPSHTSIRARLKEQSKQVEQILAQDRGKRFKRIWKDSRTLLFDFVTELQASLA